VGQRPNVNAPAVGVNARYQACDVGYSMADAERFLAELEDVGLGRPGVWVQHAMVDRADGSLIGDCASHVM
jgi:hypothetical protein